MLELCSEHDAQRLHDCINTHPSTSPSSPPQGTMTKGESAQGPIAETRNLQALRAVFGGCVDGMGCLCIRHGRCYEFAIGDE